VSSRASLGHESYDDSLRSLMQSPWSRIKTLVSGTTRDSTARITAQEHARLQRELNQLRRQDRRSRAAIRNLQRYRDAVREIRGPGTRARKSLERVVRDAQRDHARAVFVSEIIKGTNPADALLRTTRSMMAANEASFTIRALAQAGLDLGAPAPAVAVVTGLGASVADPPRLSLARYCFGQDATVEYVRRFAAEEAVGAALHLSDEGLLATVLNGLGEVPTPALVGVAELLLGHGEWERLDQARHELGTRDMGDLLRARASALDVWAGRHRSFSGSSDSQRRVAVLAPEGPDPAVTASIGDHTNLLGLLAAIRQTLPHDELTFVPQHLPGAEPPQGEQLLLIAGATEARAFGRLGHGALEVPGLKIIIGWRPSTVTDLSEVAVASLRASQPIGCADWAGVEQLLARGVDAFQSGPAAAMVDEEAVTTMAADALALAAEPTNGNRPSAPPRWPARLPVTDPLSPRTAIAARLLATTLGVREPVVTGDAAMAAALAALDVPVEPRPKNSGDPSWDGLMDVADRPGKHRDMGLRVRQALEAVVTAARSGATSEEIHSRWSRSWVSDVERCKRLQAGPLPEVEPLDTDKLATDVRALQEAYGPRQPRPSEVHVVFASDTNLEAQLPVAVNSLVRKSSRPLTVWILHRGFTRAYREAFAAAFPAVRLVFLPCDAVQFPDARLYRHITPSTMDRLLLPVLLPSDVDRVIYIDVDALVVDDISELADLDLGDAYFAARSTSDYPTTFVFEAVRRRSRTMAFDVGKELRNLVHSRFTEDTPGFNAGVLVLSLDRLRAVDFCDCFLGWVSHFGLHDQELLQYAIGNHRVDLPARWNMWPSREAIINPGIVHWLGPNKPWKHPRVAAGEHWASAEQDLSQLATWLPRSGGAPDA